MATNFNWKKFVYDVNKKRKEERQSNVNDDNIDDDDAITTPDLYMIKDNSPNNPSGYITYNYDTAKAITFICIGLNSNSSYISFWFDTRENIDTTPVHPYLYRRVVAVLNNHFLYISRRAEIPVDFNDMEQMKLHIETSENMLRRDFIHVNNLTPQTFKFLYDKYISENNTLENFITGGNMARGSMNVARFATPSNIRGRYFMHGTGYCSLWNKMSDLNDTAKNSIINVIIKSNFSNPVNVKFNCFDTKPSNLRNFLSGNSNELSAEKLKHVEFIRQWHTMSPKQKHNPYYRAFYIKITGVDPFGINDELQIHRKNIKPGVKNWAPYSESVDKLKGGKADNLPDSYFNKKQLEIGIKVEREHTNDIKLAKEIAKDHLFEDPKYYIKLKRIHLDNYILRKPLIENFSKFLRLNKKLKMLIKG